MDTTVILIAASVLVLALGIWFFRRNEKRRTSRKIHAKDPTLEIVLPEHRAETIPSTPPPRPQNRENEASSPRADNAGDIREIRKGLSSTRHGFIERLATLFSKGREHKAYDDKWLEEVEEILIGSDVGAHASSQIVEKLRNRIIQESSTQEGLDSRDSQLWSILEDEIRTLLTPAVQTKRTSSKPYVILVVGVNGVGKTTTIGKLAHRFQSEGKRVVLAAGDTYRAAAVLQLEVWGRRVGCTVIKGAENADPGSVIFDAIKQAQTEGADILIADTAGRLHSNAPLMDELRKVSRIVEKARSGIGPDEVLLVLDGTTGQNALTQSRVFREALSVTGLVVTKLDGTAKGGAIVAIVDETHLPVRYVGLGERIEDLREFDPEQFVQAWFEDPNEEQERVPQTA